MASFIIQPNFVNVFSSGITLTLKGTSTNWLTNSTTFSISGGTGAAITAQGVTSNTLATITLTAGTSLGTLTVTASDGSGTATITVVNWALVVDDDFYRNNGALGSPSHQDGSLNYWSPSTNGAWVDQFSEGTCNIIGHVAEFTNGSSFTSPIGRPTAEAETNQRAVARFLFSTVTAGISCTLMLRNNGGSSSGTTDYYLATVILNGGSSYGSVSTYIAGTRAGVTGSTTIPFFTPTAGHIYELDFSVTGTSPTQLALHLYDCGTNGLSHTYVGSCGGSDSTSGLQVAGTYGMGATVSLSSQNIQCLHFSAMQQTTQILLPSSTTYQQGQSSFTNNLSGSTGTSNTSWSGSPFTIYNYAGLSNASLSSQTAPTATTGSVTLNTGSSSGTLWIIDNVGNYYPTSIVAGALTINPTYLLTGQTANIDVQESGVTFTPGTPGSPTFTVGSGLTKNSQVVNTTSDATVNVTAGSTSQVSTITDATSGGSANLNILQQVYVNDANILWAPYAWYHNGSTSCTTNCQNAYFKMYFTGTSLSILFDLSINAGISSLSNTQFNVIIDGVTQVTNLTLASVNSSNVMPVISGLASGTHSIEFRFLWYQENVDDIWNVPTGGLRITGFLLDVGATTVPINGSIAFVKRPNKVIFYGDSITQGKGVIPGSPNPPTPPLGTTGIGAWTDAVATFLNAEYGNRGFGGNGWVQPGLGNMVNFYPNGWDNYYLNTSMLSGGSYIEGAPTYIIVNLGTNDVLYSSSQTNVTNNVKNYLTAERAACGPNTIIYVLAPFGGFCASGSNVSLITGFNNYQTATPDPKCFLINSYLNESEFGLTDSGTVPNYNSQDSIHPFMGRDIQLAAMVCRGIAATQVSPSRAIAGSRNSATGRRLVVG